MFRSWIFLCLVLGAVTAQDDSWFDLYEDGPIFDDQPLKSIRDEENSRQLDENLEFNPDVDDQPKDDIPDESVASDDVKDIDIAVQEEIEQLRKELDEPNSKVVDDIDDFNYQFEDNRSESKEIVPEKNADDDLPREDNDDFEARDNQEAEPLSETDSGEDYPEFVYDLPPLPAPDQIVEDAKEILEEENSPFEEDIENDNSQEIQQENDDLVPAEDNNEEVYNHLVIENDDIDETEGNEPSQNEEVNQNDDLVPAEDNNNHLANENDYMDEIVENDPNQKEDVVEPNEKIEEIDAAPGSFEANSNEESAAMDEPPVIKYEDDMFYGENNANDENNDDQLAEANVNEEIEEAEDKMDADDEEDTVAKAYADLNDDLTKLFETWDKLNDDTDENNDDVLDYEEKYGKPFREDVVLSQRNNYEDYDENDENIDSNLDDIFNDEQSIYNEVKEIEDTDPIVEEKQAEDIAVPIPFSEDAFEVPKEEIPEESSEKHEEEVEQTTPFKIIDVDDLTPSQYNEMMGQFAAAYSETLDTKSDDFGQNIAPVHMTINAEEAIEITSPNFPNAYPSNNIVDWILEGDGTGIELNITDLEVRGPNGDYLLIKPGGAEDGEHSGLVFSYHLTEPRHYRFTDVNRLFIRFESGQGLGFLKGFRLTTKMIWPPATDEDEEAPEPEALLPPPPATLTVVLGGITEASFQDIRDEFQRLVADMATMYINANSIELGLNETSEVTQITATSICNINWPGYSDCVSVTFGVPLVYGEEPSSRLDERDLTAMWNTYVVQDPFAARLNKMGISEFSIPNDSRVLMLWLVIAGGAVISAVLLALAVWRYSCFEDYTRMKAYGDTDSLHGEKRGLEDLYPTPHQNLPPLYADNDSKWADSKYDDSTRVDMGGFTNRSYTRDELFDIDSDEDVITPRDRYTTDV